MRTSTLTIVLVFLSALGSSARACSVHGSTAANDVWNATGSSGGVVTGELLLESTLVVPTSSTVCVAGIGMGTVSNPLPAGVDVVGVAIVVAHADGSRTPLSAFAFAPNGVTSAAMASGSGSSVVPGTNPLFAGSTWFGFSSTVEPFAPPVLGAGEFTAFQFALEVDRALLPLEVDTQFAAGEGLPSGTPIFSGDHPAQYFAAANPSVVLTAPVPEPSSWMMLVLAALCLGIGSRLAR